MFEQLEQLLEVRDEGSARIALSMAMQSRKLEKALDETRAEITKPHLDYQRAVNRLAKSYQLKLEQIEHRLQQKIEKWMVEQQDNPFTKVDEIRVDDGTLYTQKHWDFTVDDDSDELPREYMIANSVAIKDAIKKGIRNIPGVSIYQVEQVVMRVKNN